MPTVPEFVKVPSVVMAPASTATVPAFDVLPVIVDVPVWVKLPAPMFSVP